MGKTEWIRDILNNQSVMTVGPVILRSYQQNEAGNTKPDQFATLSHNIRQDMGIMES